MLLVVVKDQRFQHFPSWPLNFYLLPSKQHPSNGASAISIALSQIHAAACFQTIKIACFDFPEKGLVNQIQHFWKQCTVNGLA
jgi:hypothetical protein